mmetsp:Transcript_17948/g.45213  ORF Transcript_17948/g.45213 Transcript_17948/m.45213 type:complete len:208 (-) Transcript_17948:41-664(-)
MLHSVIVLALLEQRLGLVDDVTQHTVRQLPLRARPRRDVQLPVLDGQQQQHAVLARGAAYAPFGVQRLRKRLSCARVIPAADLEAAHDCHPHLVALVAVTTAWDACVGALACCYELDHPLQHVSALPSQHMVGITDPAGHVALRVALAHIRHGVWEGLRCPFRCQEAMSAADSSQKGCQDKAVATLAHQFSSLTTSVHPWLDKGYLV